MTLLNKRAGPPEVVAQYWVGAVGGNQSLVGVASGLACRAVIVGVVGTLLLVDILGNTHTFLAADIIAQGYILRGQWVQATAVGSTAHTLTAWW